MVHNRQWCSRLLLAYLAQNICRLLGCEDPRHGILQCKMDGCLDPERTDTRNKFRRHTSEFIHRIGEKLIQHNARGLGRKTRGIVRVLTPCKRLELLIEKGGLDRCRDIVCHLRGNVSAHKLLAHLGHHWFQISLLEHLTVEPTRGHRPRNGIDDGSTDGLRCVRQESNGERGGGGAKALTKLLAVKKNSTKASKCFWGAMRRVACLAKALGGAYRPPENTQRKLTNIILVFPLTHKSRGHTLVPVNP